MISHRGSGVLATWMRVRSSGVKWIRSKNGLPDSVVVLLELPVGPVAPRPRAAGAGAARSRAVTGAARVPAASSLCHCGHVTVAQAEAGSRGQGLSAARAGGMNFEEPTCPTRLLGLPLRIRTPRAWIPSESPGSRREVLTPSRTRWAGERLRDSPRSFRDVDVPGDSIRPRGSAPPSTVPSGVDVLGAEGSRGSIAATSASGRGCVQGSGVRVRPDPGVCSGIGMVPA